MVEETSKRTLIPRNVLVLTMSRVIWSMKNNSGAGKRDYPGGDWDRVPQRVPDVPPQDPGQPSWGIPLPHDTALLWVLEAGILLIGLVYTWLVLKDPEKPQEQPIYLGHV